MIKITTIIAVGLLLVGCGSSYDKSPEDWRSEVCTCVQEEGPEACGEVMEKLRDYYGEDYKTHDKTINLILKSCPEVVLSVELD